MKKLFLIFVIARVFFANGSLFAMEDMTMTEISNEILFKAPTWKFLNDRDCIEIITPSAAPLTVEQVQAAKELISQYGFKSSLPDGGLNNEVSRYKYYANSDEERAQNVINALQGDSKILWALLGGYGAVEVVDILERYSFFPPKQPKLILGFSDITALHLLADRWGWPSLHGPLLGFGKELFSVTKEDVNSEVKLSAVLKILKGEITHLEHSFEVIHPGNLFTETPILGSVMGGNLSILENHSGTKTALKGKDRFIFFEDTPEDGKRLHRRLMNLVRAGVFNEAKGIIVGSNPIEKFEDSPEETKSFIKNFVHQVLLPRNINFPVIYSPRFGHGPYNDVMPLGTIASLSIHEEQAILKVSVNESAYTHDR